MFERSREDVAAGRARWLAEVAAALDEARALLINPGLGTEPTREAVELYLRIEAARLEVQALRLSRMVRGPGETSPNRTESPWLRRIGGS